MQSVNARKVLPEKKWILFLQQLKDEKIRSGLKTVPFLKKKCAIIGQMAERKCFYGYG